MASLAGLCRVVTVIASAASAAAQLRVAEWNVTNYGGGRTEAFETCLYGDFEGRSMSPDILIGQEFKSQEGVNAFLGILNNAPGSPGDWHAAPFFDGPDSDSTLFYRRSKVDLLGANVVSPGGDPPVHPRHVVRYDIRPAGYGSADTIIACYSSHMKSGSTDLDRARRLDEAMAIRIDAASLPTGWSYLLGADLNIRSSSEAAYAALTNPADQAGRFDDPIAMPGSWQGDPYFRFVHTQDPVGSGGMDDRFDQLLASASLLDGAGLDYIGDPAVPFSSETWNDPNHSYRCWGNDGTSFNTALTVNGNTMVGAEIAQALREAAASGGHLPVFLDLRLPAQIAAPEVVDFGQVPRGEAAERSLTVTNTGDTALWTPEGIADLHYGLSASAGFTAPAAPFVESPGGGSNVHTLSMDTTRPGVKHGLLTITSDAPDSPLLLVELRGVVLDRCYPDLDRNDALDLFDFLAFANLYNQGDPLADCDADGSHDLFDFLCFTNAFNVGC